VAPELAVAVRRIQWLEVWPAADAAASGATLPRPRSRADQPHGRRLYMYIGARSHAPAAHPAALPIAAGSGLCARVPRAAGEPVPWEGDRSG
jgi:hypothetical protein